MDKEYWNNFYAKYGEDSNINMQSSFATFCQKEYFSKKNLKITELGSGNGRDALFFAQHNHNIIAIDQSTVAIDIERKNLSDDIRKNLIPKAVDFVTEDYSKLGDIDVFYSRFTLHAISKDDENIIIPKIYTNLKIGGLLCIEVRTINDDLCGVGEDLGNNSYFTDHYRRFIDSHEFLNNAIHIGFKLKYFVEKNNLSVYKDDNPVLMRIILEK